MSHTIAYACLTLGYHSPPEPLFIILLLSSVDTVINFFSMKKEHLYWSSQQSKFTMKLFETSSVLTTLHLGYVMIRRWMPLYWIKV